MQKHECYSLLLDKLSTRNILKRKNTRLDSFDCALCQDATEETMEHVFLGCTFATEGRFSYENLGKMIL
jgi:hypothetical protein